MGGLLEGRLLLVTGEAGAVSRGVVRSHCLGSIPGCAYSERESPRDEQHNPGDLGLRQTSFLVIAATACAAARAVRAIYVMLGF